MTRIVESESDTGKNVCFRSGNARFRRHRNQALTMSAPFDPYHQWLGIPPKDQPPNYYRLLGIELLESDMGVISFAADRQMGFIRMFESGQHGKLSQKLLNEIARARLCLLDPHQKDEYDSGIVADLPVVEAF